MKVLLTLAVLFACSKCSRSPIRGWEPGCSPAPMQGASPNPCALHGETPSKALLSPLVPRALFLHITCKNHIFRLL